MSGLGVALGIGSAVIGGISSMRQASAQRAAQRDAQRQNDALTQQMMQDQANIRRETEMNKMRADQESELNRLKAASILPSDSINTTPGMLQTISTSPLGDTTDPYTSRKKLLGA